MPKHKNLFLWFAVQNIIARLLGSAMWLVKIHHSFSRPYIGNEKEVNPNEVKIHHSLSRHTQTGLLRILV